MSLRTVSVSVRDLVEFILRCGDIDTGTGNLIDVDAMHQGSKMHRRLQKAAGPSYKAEVSLKHTYPVDDQLEILVEGRADGIITENEMRADDAGMLELKEVVTIDEIKGTYRDVRRITSPVQTHMAQAMCYAYFYSLQEKIDLIKVQVRYVNLENSRMKVFEEEYDQNELAVWYEELMSKYVMWIKWEMDWQKIRNVSIASCAFPFEYRESQKKIVAGVYQTIVRRKRLFIEAPTGTGKTLAVLYPAIQAQGKEMVNKIFYLTARTIARTVAEDSLALMRRTGLHMKAVTLTAKDKLCIFDEANCHPGICPRAKGHYDRVNEAVFDILTHEEAINRECICCYAEKHQVCPFEMQLDVSLWIDMIIGDYNYVFDPDIALKRFFAERADDYLFLVDEAHNLVDRAREMYSAILELGRLEHVKKEMIGIDRKFSDNINRCLRLMRNMRDDSEEPCRLVESVGGLMACLTKLEEAMEALLKEDVAAVKREQILDLYFEVRHFVNAFDRSDDRYLIYEMRDDSSYRIKIFCVDPSKDISERLALGRSAMFFSATLLPVSYYKDMISDTRDVDYDLYVDSPFDPGKRLLVAADDVSSRYNRRGRKEYEKIASYIHTIVRGKRGNYMIFFPSYQLMQDVFDVFTEQELVLAGHGLRIMMQESAMNEDQRQEFLEAFDNDASQSVVAFCVMGGIFSEGIDLKEDQLIGAIVVGTGLPQVGTERQLLRTYFDQRGIDGFAYAYLYPGMNKVLQAAGRVIRTQNDEGVIALLDERFHWSQYRQIFPRDWEDCRVTNLATINDQVELFWTKD